MTVISLSLDCIGRVLGILAKKKRERESRTGSSSGLFDLLTFHLVFISQIAVADL